MFIIGLKEGQIMNMTFCWQLRDPVEIQLFVCNEPMENEMGRKWMERIKTELKILAYSVLQFSILSEPSAEWKRKLQIFA